MGKTNIELGIEKGFKFDIVFKKENKDKRYNAMECEILQLSPCFYIAFKNISGFHLIPFDNIVEITPSSLTMFDKIKKGGK